MDDVSIPTTDSARTWKQVVIWGVLLIGLLVIGYTASSDLTVSVGQSAGFFSSEEIQGSVTAGQTFIAPYPGLNRIAVMMHTFDRVNTHDVTFHLKQGREAQEDIFTANFNARDVKDKQWQSFSFPPLDDSGGNTYYLYFESPGSTPGNAIAVMGQEGDPYPDGVGYVNDEPVPGDMAFKTYYRATLPKHLDFLLDRFTANKPSLWGSRYVYVSLGIFYLALGVLCLRHMGRLDDTMDTGYDDRATLGEDQAGQIIDGR